MQRYINKIILLLMMLAGVFVFQFPVEAVTHTTTMSNIGYDNDIIVNGAQTNLSVQFPVPLVNLQMGSSIQLTVVPAQYLHGNSSFNFYVNDRQVTTLSVAQLRAKPTVLLPLQTGVNTERSVRMDIKANIFATDYICRDYQRGQLFYTVSNKSGLVLNFVPIPPKTISDFFHSLYNGVLIIIPENPSIGEITSGAWAFGFLQKNYPYLPVKLIHASERDKYPNIPRLWISTKEHLPQALSKSEQGIYLAYADTVVISGGNDAALKGNVKNLFLYDIMNAIPAAELTPEDQKNIFNKSKTIHFGNNTVQEGILTVPMDFIIYPSMLTDIPQHLKFHLEGRYSVNNTSSKQPRLDVFFNRNLIYSELLNSSGVLDKDISLPKILPIKTRNVLSIQINHPEETGSCKVYGTTQTAQIFNTSYFSGSGSYPNDLLAWDSIGLMFNNNGVILLDDDLASNIIQAAAQTVYFINRQLPEGKFVFPEMNVISQYKNVNKPSYLVVLGMNEKIPEELQEKLPLRGSANFSIYSNKNQSIEYRYQPSADIGLGQIGYYQNTPLMLLSANFTDKNITALLQSLNVSSNSNKLTGNILIIKENGSMVSFDSRESNIFLSAARSSVPSVLLNIWERSTDFVREYQTFILIGFLIIIAGVFIKLVLSLYRKPRDK